MKKTLYIVLRETYLNTQGPHGTGCLDEVACAWDIWVPGHLCWPATSSQDEPDLSWPRIKNTESSMLKSVLSAISRLIELGVKEFT